MPMFVHIADDRMLPAIRRIGLRCAAREDGIYAMPVTPNFLVSHQWLRELKTRGARTLAGVYFRIPDDEPVRFGHFGGPHLTMPAAAAVGEVLRAREPLGLEIIVPRSVSRNEIHRVRQIPQIMGWRYHPAVRSRSYCTCPLCVTKGTIKAARKRAEGEERERAADVAYNQQLLREGAANSGG